MRKQKESATTSIPKSYPSSSSHEYVNIAIPDPSITAMPEGAALPVNDSVNTDVSVEVLDATSNTINYIEVVPISRAGQPIAADSSCEYSQIVLSVLFM